MKKNGLRILIILALFLFSCTEAFAACSWTEKKTVFSPSGSPTTTGGCNTQTTTESDASKCNAATKPKDSNSQYLSISNVCCCTKAGTAENINVPAEPKFKLPDYVFQIPIGTLSRLNTVDCSSGTCEIPFIAQYISAVYKYGLSIAGVLGVLMLMAAGLLWIVSGGDSGKITTAKNLIIGSVTGLILLVGLNLFLTFINPDLVNPQAITLESIERKEIEALAEGRNGSTAESFKNSKCATDEELENGTEFYATGYYKPAYNNSSNFFCVVAMQCSCPAGVDTGKTCDIYKNTYPNYHPCKYFGSATPYCNMTSSGSAPQIGDIAGPACSNLPKGSYVCFKGKTYRITDSGGGIKGKRIDIWSGSDLKQAYSNTGVGKLTKGPCK